MQEAEINSKLAACNPVDRIQVIHGIYGRALVSTTSGGETSALIPNISRIALPHERIPIFFVDTLHYNEETYRQIAILQKDGFDVRKCSPERRIDPPDEQSHEFDDWLYAVKHEPLERAFRDYQRQTGIEPLVWMDGILAPREEKIFYFRNGIYHFHPILDWTKEKVLAYLNQHGLPMNRNHRDITKGSEFKNECKIRERVNL
jgi:3'-phosphoadenosine 5'-phosphosulfate sulfotransferase (PAPS reductase)/FAD synthetase